MIVQIGRRDAREGGIGRGLTALNDSIFACRSAAVIAHMCRLN
jgi:hypothetical protein